MTGGTVGIGDGEVFSEISVPQGQNISGTTFAFPVQEIRSFTVVKEGTGSVTVNFSGGGSIVMNLDGSRSWGTGDDSKRLNTNGLSIVADAGTNAEVIWEE